MSTKKLYFLPHLLPSNHTGASPFSRVLFAMFSFKYIEEAKNALGTQPPGISVYIRITVGEKMNTLVGTERGMAL